MARTVSRAPKSPRRAPGRRSLLPHVAVAGLSALMLSPPAGSGTEQVQLAAAPLGPEVPTLPAPAVGGGADPPFRLRDTAPARPDAAPAREPAQPGPTRPEAASAQAADAGDTSPQPPTPLALSPRGTYHEVVAGDTLEAIAAGYGLADHWPVYDANPIVGDGSGLAPGQWLYIPHPTIAVPPRPRPGEPGANDRQSVTYVDEAWLALAACESSLDWAADTGNGYYGGLQFLPSSWELVGGTGLPSEAHPLEQIARAERLLAIQGWVAWPVCSVKLGLRPPDPVSQP